MGSKQRRNISIDREVNQWLKEDVENASKLISDLLKAYRAHGGKEVEAVQYILEKRVCDTEDELRE